MSSSVTWPVVLPMDAEPGARDAFAMNFKGIEICCPQCREELDQPGEDQLRCRGCRRVYPVLLEIPDLRVFPDPYISLEEDRAKALRLAQRFTDFDFEELIHYYYSNTPAVPPHHARLYTRGLMAAAGRAGDWLRSWEATAGDGAAEALLDIGCGTAPLLVAANKYPCRVGVDIAFRWLLVGKKRLAEAGLNLPLICACAEALPFHDAVFDRVVTDSALEHWKDQPRGLAEVRRVIRPGGRLFIATPNRFSLGPDPQTGMWAGGWLPESWTGALVRRQGGVPPVRHLLNGFALRHLLRKANFEEIRIYLPTVPEAQRRHFSGIFRALLAAYDMARRLPISRSLLYWIGPMLHAVAKAPEGSARNV